MFGLTDGLLSLAQVVALKTPTEAPLKCFAMLAQLRKSGDERRPSAMAAVGLSTWDALSTGDAAVLRWGVQPDGPNQIVRPIYCSPVQGRTARRCVFTTETRFVWWILGRFTPTAR